MSSRTCRSLPDTPATRRRARRLRSARLCGSLIGAMILGVLGCSGTAPGGGGDCPLAGRLCVCDGGTGLQVCVDGGSVCDCEGSEVELDAVPDMTCLASGPEICNGRDDDCDGTVDELSGVCQQAGTCFAGRRTCADQQTPAGDVVVCRDGTGIDRPLVGDERCSGQDDDCDGLVDEGFDTMVDPEHCGACGRDCAAPYGVALDGATFACEAGVCRVEACGPGREDVDGRADNGCECAPDAPDGPDPLFADADCDDRVDEDVDPAGVIFVDAAAQPGGDGGPDAPIVGLLDAVTVAESSGASQLVIAAGTYDLHPGLADDDPARLTGLTVPDGLWLRGGFARDAQGWHRPRGGDNRSLVTGANPVLRYAGLSRATVLEGLDIVASPGLDGTRADEGPVPGSGSIAVLAEEVGEHLIIANCLLEGEDAGRGYRGSTGAEGRAGGDGGRPGEAEGLAVCRDPNAGSRCGGLRGVTRGCQPPSTVPVGGDGGFSESRGAAGAASGAPPAAGGAAGGDGADGSPGGPGADGVVGGSKGRMTAASRWIPEVGTDGRPGQPGNGGGGGGGSRVYGGGGGGGGGCPGQPGGAAEGGYASIGLLIRGGRVRLVDGPEGERAGRLEIRARRGGPGGTAGRGGAGGRGGRGAAGEPEAGPCPGCTPAGAGGPGGAGGCGGHGGPGAGGPAFAILRVSPPGGSINASRAIFLRALGDPTDPGRRSTVDDPLAAVDAYLGVLSGGSGGRAGGGPDCPATTDDGPDGLAASVGCCVADDEGRCAPLGPCAP